MRILNKASTSTINEERAMSSKKPSVDGKAGPKPILDSLVPNEQVTRSATDKVLSRFL